MTRVYVVLGSESCEDGSTWLEGVFSTEPLAEAAAEMVKVLKDKDKGVYIGTDASVFPVEVFDSLDAWKVSKQAAGEWK